MNVFLWIGLVLAIGAALYLIGNLLFPEVFSS